MSNIAIYTSQRLSAHTSFLNGFLDDMLEVYCSKRYAEGDALSRFPNISLSDVVLDYYPDYYFKSPGLLGHKMSTDVKLIYEPELHSIIIEALDHKLKQMFLTFEVPTQELDITTNLQRSRNFRTLFSNSNSILNYFHNLSKFRINFEEVDKFFGSRKVDFDFIKTGSYYIYKPYPGYVEGITSLIKTRNAQNFKQKTTFFILNSSSSDNFNIQFAFSLQKSSINYYEYFPDEFVKELRVQADLIMKATEARFENYCLDIVERKALKKAQEEAKRKALADQETARQKRIAEERKRLDDLNRVIPPPPPPPPVREIPSGLIKAHRQNLRDELDQQSKYTNSQAIWIVIGLLVSIFVLVLIMFSQRGSL